MVFIEKGEGLEGPVGEAQEGALMKTGQPWSTLFSQDDKTNHQTMTDLEVGSPLRSILRMVCYGRSQTG